MISLKFVKNITFGCFVSLISLQNSFCQTENGEVKAKSSSIRLKQTLPSPQITVLSPSVPKGKVYFHDANKITIKGFVKAKKLLYLTIDKIETHIEPDGSFSQDVKIKFEDNYIVLKAIDYNTTVTTDTIIINRPLNVTGELANKTNGTNYALLIGTNKYQNMGQLINPCFDISTIEHELDINYKNTTDMVLNPSSDKIYTALRKYSSMKFKDDDQLFIMISGHGEFDEMFKEGYIVPSDAKKNDNNKTSYISHSNLRTIINNIPCKHIFLVLDVCFGGTFDQAVAHKGVEVNLSSNDERDKFINRKLKYKTRLYLTSGGKVYVPDGRPGHHSPFARKFIEALRSFGGEDKVLTMSEILSFVEKVTPEARNGEFGDNEPGSDFLFIAH